MRVTNAPASRKRRTRMIRAAKGFRMRRSKLYRYASDAVDHGRAYAYRDRKTKKPKRRRNLRGTSTVHHTDEYRIKQNLPFSH